MIFSTPILWLQAIIVILLLFGAYSDWKYRAVSNWITIPIILFSLPLIYFNLPIIKIGYHIIVVIFIIGYLINQLGGADFKVITPIVYSLNPISLAIFFIIVSITSLPFVRKNPKDIPLFIPIFLGYIINTFTFLY